MTQSDEADEFVNEAILALHAMSPDEAERFMSEAMAALRAMTPEEAERLISETTPPWGAMSAEDAGRFMNQAMAGLRAMTPDEASRSMSEAMTAWRGMSQDEARQMMSGAAVILRAVEEGATDSDFDRAVAELTAMSPQAPGRGTLAYGLLQALLRTAAQAPDRMRHTENLLAIAEADPPSLPNWPRLRAAARMQSVLYAGLHFKADAAAAFAEMDALAAVAGDDPRAVHLIDMMRTMLGFQRALDEGNETALLRLPERLGKLGPAGGNPSVDQLMAMMAEMATAMTSMRQDDWDKTLATFEQLQGSVGQLPGNPLVHATMADAAARMRLFQNLARNDAAGRPVPELDKESERVVEAMAQRPGASESDRMLDHLTLGGAKLGLGQETDLTRVDEGIEHYRKALALTGPDNPQRAFVMQSLGMGLLRRIEVSGSTAGLDEAESLLEQARDLLGGPQHPNWSFANELLSWARMRRGHGQSHLPGLDGQRGYAWRALLQSDVAGAKVAIKDADRQAIDLALRCLQANDPAGALRALDSGRGLMLFAATEVRGIAGRLREVGRADLADRWEAAAAADPGAEADDLRREALAALIAGPASIAGLLDPPELAEIQLALARLGADALVYLVPAEQANPGLAVIAPVKGPVSYMALPFLTLGGDVKVEQYLTELADRANRVGRDRDLTAPADDTGRFEGSLDALCDWAWRAAMGPLLQRYLGREPTPATGEVPRLVLIPVGDLARIPWHAARHANGTYAVQIAAISQAVSARLLCDNAARRPVPPSAVGLVVGDPDTRGRAQPLRAARREAHAIRQVFYRGARYVGRRPDGTESPSGAGTAEQVRRWLANPSPAAGAMLHLACHGSFSEAAEGAKAVLLLADDGTAERATADDATGEEPAGELSAEEIVATMVTGAQRDVGLVVLAACHTGRSVHGYDEVYSLGTAFLAGGARSVLSTQWSIPDAPTSSLMFMFHHFLRDRAMPAWQALREAQLWMLAERPEPPPHMPAELWPQPGDHAHIASWAGFVHWGQ